MKLMKSNGILQKLKTFVKNEKTHLNNLIHFKSEINNIPVKFNHDNQDWNNRKNKYRENNFF